MNFEDFEKKAKCIYCERPINIHKKHYTGVSRTGAKSKLYQCECSLSNRFKFKDGYTFNLPVCQKYDFHIDTRIKSFQIILNRTDPKTNAQIRETILDTNEIPDFILMPRLKLMDKLETFLAWI